MMQGLLGEITYAAELTTMGIDPETAKSAARQATLWRAANVAGIIAAPVDNVIPVDFISGRRNNGHV
jgi:hypothetical protein